MSNLTNLDLTLTDVEATAVECYNRQQDHRLRRISEIKGEFFAAFRGELPRYEWDASTMRHIVGKWFTVLLEWGTYIDEMEHYIHSKEGKLSVGASFFMIDARYIVQEKTQYARYTVLRYLFGNVGPQLAEDTPWIKINN